MKNKNLLCCHIAPFKTFSHSQKRPAFNHETKNGNETQTEAKTQQERIPTFIDAGVLDDTHDAALDAGIEKIDSALERAEQTDMLDAGTNQSFHPMASVDAGTTKTEKAEEKNPELAQQLSQVDAMLAKMKNFPSNLETDNLGQNLLQVRRDIEAGNTPTRSLENLSNRFSELEQKTSFESFQKKSLIQIDSMLAKMKNFPANLDSHNLGQNLLQMKKEVETGNISGVTALKTKLENVSGNFSKIEQKSLSEKMKNEIPRAIIGECKHRINNFQTKGVIPYQGINYSFTYDRSTQSFTVIAGENGAPKTFKFRPNPLPKSENLSV